MKAVLTALVSGVLILAGLGPTFGEGITAKRQQRVGEPYQAPEVMNWTGFYAGAGIGIYAGLTGLEAEGQDVFDVGNWGYLGDGRVGYDYQFPGGVLVIGGFAGYSFGEAEADIVGITATLTPTWNVGTRLGIAVDRSLLYVGYKYSEAEIEISGIADKPVYGHTLLGGVEMAAFKPLSLALEYGYTQYSDVDVQGIKVEPEAHTFMLRGNVRFGSGGITW